MKNSRVTLLALLGSLTAVQLLLAQSYNVPWHKIGGGGGTSTGGVFSISGTIGQADAGLLSGGGFNLGGGFWVWTDTQAAASPQYTVLALGSLGGEGFGADDPPSVAYDINNAGQIVGWSYTVGNSNYHAVFWTNGLSNPQDLGTLGGDFSQALGLDELGRAVGNSDTGGANQDGAIWPNNTLVPADLGNLGYGTSADAINASSQIVGWAYNSADGSSRAVFWPTPTSAPLDLGTLGGTSAEANWINDAGQIVGSANPAGSGELHAAFWTNASSAPRDLGTLGSLQSRAFKINRLGQIVGVAADASILDTRAIFWTNSSSAPVRLSTPGSDYSAATDMNDLGQIVGGVGNLKTGGSTSLRAVIWSDSRSPAVDLNTLISPASGWILLDANAINNSGEIVGDGLIGGQARAYLLIPSSVVPRITSVARFGDTLLISFTSQIGRNYNLLSCPDLASGAWTTALAGIPGNGLIVQVSRPQAFAQPSQFFRVQLAP